MISNATNLHRNAKSAEGIKLNLTLHYCTSTVSFEVFHAVYDDIMYVLIK